jgi:hypothetical protein
MDATVRPGARLTVMAATTAAPNRDPSTSPPPGPPRVGWPPAVRRSLIAIVLVGCAFALVWANSHAEVGLKSNEVNRLLVAQNPPPGGQAPQQTTVGLELLPGYDGRITINGIVIPEEQMDGAVDPQSLSAADLQKYGIRPNNRNRVYFTPGPGKVIETFKTGTVFVNVRYFRDRQPSKTLNIVSWTFKID